MRLASPRNNRSEPENYNRKAVHAILTKFLSFLVFTSLSAWVDILWLRILLKLSSELEARCRNHLILQFWAIIHWVSWYCTLRKLRSFPSNLWDDLVLTEIPLRSKTGKFDKTTIGVKIDLRMKLEKWNTSFMLMASDAIIAKCHYFSIFHAVVWTDQSESSKCSSYQVCADYKCYLHWKRKENQPRKKEITAYFLVVFTSHWRLQ